MHRKWCEENRALDRQIRLNPAPPCATFSFLRVLWPLSLPPGPRITDWQEDCWMATQVRDVLLAENEQFKKLVTEHSQYSQRLDSLIQKRYLSEDEKIEEVRLKKLKLRLKDQMELLEREFRRSNNVA